MGHFCTADGKFRHVFPKKKVFTIQEIEAVLGGPVSMHKLLSDDIIYFLQNQKPELGFNLYAKQVSKKEIYGDILQVEPQEVD